MLIHPTSADYSLSAKIRTKWIIGHTKWMLEYFSYLALVEYRTKWIRIKWGPGVLIVCKIAKKIYKHDSRVYEINKLHIPKFDVGCILNFEIKVFEWISIQFCSLHNQWNLLHDYKAGLRYNIYLLKLLKDA